MQVQQHLGDVVDRVRFEELEVDDDVGNGSNLRISALIIKCGG